MRDFEATDWEIFEEKESLSGKIFDSKLALGDDISKIFAKDVKEKIQNVQKRLKEELENRPPFAELDEKRSSELLMGELEIIDKIFKEEFGEKLIC